MARRPAIEVELPSLGKLVLDIDADASITDLDEDMSQAAPLVAWYGRLTAAARQEVDRLEDAVKKAKARKLAGIFGYDPKVAEWKAKAEMEGDEAIEELQTLVGRAWYVANTLSAAFEAMKVKADILRSKSSMMRAELERTSGPVPPTRAELVEGTREALRKRD
jgi:hypothetical protein